MTIGYCSDCKSEFGHRSYCRRLEQTTTTVGTPPCEHGNGWYITVRFWWFKKRLFVCSDCGEQIEVPNAKVSGAGTASAGLPGCAPVVE